MIETLVQEWIYKFDAWNHKSEASKALVSAISHYIVEKPKNAISDSQEYIDREKIEAEKLRQAIQDAAMNIR